MNRGDIPDLPAKLTAIRCRPGCGLTLGADRASQRLSLSAVKGAGDEHWSADLFETIGALVRVGERCANFVQKIVNLTESTRANRPWRVRSAPVSHALAKHPIGEAVDRGPADVRLFLGRAETPENGDDFRLGGSAGFVRISAIKRSHRSVPSVDKGGDKMRGRSASSGTSSPAGHGQVKGVQCLTVARQGERAGSVLRGVHSAPLRLEDGATDKLGNLRDYGVSAGSNSVQPMGNPISCSASSGRYQSRPISFRAVLHPCEPPGPQRLFIGVGNNPESVAEMVGANCGSRYSVPFRVIPELGKLPENVAKPSVNESWAVFHDDDARSYLANKSPELAPQAAAVAFQAETRSCEANILARKSSHDCIGSDPIGSKSLCGKASNVIVAGHLGPVFLEDALAERVDLAERDSLEPARAFQAKVEAADAGEQAEDFEFLPPHRSPPIIRETGFVSIGEVVRGIVVRCENAGEEYASTKAADNAKGNHLLELPPSNGEWGREDEGRKEQTKSSLWRVMGDVYVPSDKADGENEPANDKQERRGDLRSLSDHPILSPFKTRWIAD